MWHSIRIALSFWSGAFRIDGGDNVSFAKENAGETEVVTLSGRFDTESAEAIEKDFDELAADGKTVVVMESVEYISSSMIRVLLKSLKMHRSSGGDLQLAALQPQIFKVLKIAGMDALFTIHESRESALE